MRVSLAAVAALALLASACGGSGDTAAPEPTATAVAEATATTAPTAAPAPTPEELALADSDVVISGDAGALVTAGEEIEITHLVRNRAVGSLSLGFRTQQEDDQLDVGLSTTSVRLGSEETLVLTSTVTVPDDAAVGEVFAYEVVAVDVDDIDQRSIAGVQLLVVDAQGARPVAGADSATTTTNQKVLVYVIGDDTDPDGDLDRSSLRVIGGGYLADEILGNGNGFITYIPFANVTGRDLVLYEVCDAEERCDTAVVTVDVSD